MGFGGKIALLLGVLALISMLTFYAEGKGALKKERDVLESANKTNAENLRFSLDQVEEIMQTLKINRDDLESMGERVNELHTYIMLLEEKWLDEPLMPLPDPDPDLEEGDTSPEVENY